MEVSVLFPIRGLSDNYSFTQQQPGTTRVGKNVTSLDQTTGRIRGAKRAGLSKFNSNQINGANAVDHLISYVLDDDLTTYTAKLSNARDVVWSDRTPSRTAPRNVVTDRQSNVYVTDGDGGLVKYTSDGELIYQFAFPTSRKRDKIRALEVDDFDYVYAGVSEGRPSTARLWRYRQVRKPPSDENELCVKDTEPSLVQEWQVEPGALIEDIVVKNGLVYTIQNNPLQNRAWLRVYDAITSKAGPDLVLDKEIGHPASGLSVNNAGAAFVAMRNNTQRGKDFRAPAFDPKAEDWTPEDLEFWEKRGYRWHYAPDLLSEQFLAAPLENGDSVILWPDRTEQRRDLFYDSSVGNPPTLLELGVGAKASVHFDGVDQWLSSGSNTEVESEFEDQQQSLLPGHESAGWAVFMVVRYPREANIRCVLSQHGVDTDADYFRIFTNRDSTGVIPGTVNAGDVSVFDYDDPADVAHGGLIGGGHRQPRSADHLGTSTQPPIFEPNDNDYRTCIVAYVQASGETTNNRKTLFSVNGVPIDRFDSQPFQTTERGALGRDLHPTLATDYFQGDICEVLVLRDYVDDSGLERIIEMPTYPDSAWAPGGSTEFEKVIGWLAWRWGVAGVLEPTDPSPPAGVYPHPWALDVGPPTDRPDGVSPEGTIATSPTGILAKIDSATGEAKWALSGTNLGGLGVDCIVNCDGDVYSIGPHEGTGTTDVRLVKDLDDSFSVDILDGAWDANIFGSDEQDFDHTKVDTDKIGNLYLPWHVSDPAVGGVSLFVYDKTGATRHNIPIFADGEDGTQDGNLRRAVAVAHDRNIPDYHGDLDAAGLNIIRAEFVYVVTTTFFEDQRAPLQWTNATRLLDSQGADLFADFVWYDGATFTITAGTGTSPPEVTTILSKVDDDTIEILQTGVATDGATDVEGDLLVNPINVPSVFKLRLVDADEDTSGSPRAIVNLAVAGGSLLSYAEGAGAPAIVTGGTSAWTGDGKFYQSAQVRGDLFLTDGLESLKVYRRDKQTGLFALEAMKAKHGRLPQRPKLLATWRGRLVTARFPDNPQNYVMSSALDAYDFDLFPDIVSASTAVAGNSPNRAGLVPDVINGLIPYDDDVLVFLCDHSIHMLSGDPMDNGHIDLVTDEDGGALGSPWAKDPQGRLFYFGSKGGLMHIVPSPGAKPQRISIDTIERRLQDVDLALHRIELTWNRDEEALHVWVIPFGAYTGVGTHFRWIQKTNSWFEDTFGKDDYLGVQPKSVVVQDGDEPEDRVMLLGCQDGYVRRWDQAAKSDDVDGSANPIPIKAEVIIGPISVGKVGYESMMTGFWPVLAAESDGARFEVLSSDRADHPLDEPLASGEIGPGFADGFSARAAGSYLWLRLFNFDPESWFAYEEGYCELELGGRRRPMGPARIT